MINGLEFITLLVKDQDEAMAFYTEKLGFEKQIDADAGNGLRWLVVAPQGGKGPGLALLQAQSDEEKKTVGKQSGGRIPLFVFLTDDFMKTYEELKDNGVEFAGEPMDNPWGVAVQFFDLYGNKFDLVQPREM